MVDTQEIYDFSQKLYGGEVSEQVLKRLCQVSSQELVSRLREGVDAQEIEEQFVAAAAMLALSLYLAAEYGENVESFAAGSLSVKLSGERVSAASLRRQAELILSAYLKDQGFAFLGVEG
jgi:hypothetical protein